MAFRERSAGLLEEALDMLLEADRMHRHFFTLALDHAGPCWEPPIDIVETGQALIVSVALPGVAPDGVEVRNDGAKLTVVGVRPLPVGPGDVIHRLEIPYGRFERCIDLPSGRFEIASRRIADGCLVLKLRRLS
jgi:HSP20 family protein